MRESVKLTFKILGTLALIMGSFMIPCVCAAVVYGELDCAKPFFTCSLLYICFGLIIKGLIKTKNVNLLTRQSYVIVILCWIFCVLLDMIPMYCTSQGYSLSTCLFESVSSITTTGCTSIDVNLLPKSMFLWRHLKIKFSSELIPMET